MFVNQLYENESPQLKGSRSFILNFLKGKCGASLFCCSLVRNENSRSPGYWSPWCHLLQEGGALLRSGPWKPRHSAPLLLLSLRKPRWGVDKDCPWMQLHVLLKCQDSYCGLASTQCLQSSTVGFMVWRDTAL